ncbi:hypothetical protein LguiA_022299 [Lonicera macranthoides]
MADPDPLLAEAISLREALSWIKDKNMSNVYVESDSQLLISAIRSDFEDSSYFGLIVNECKSLASGLVGCHFNFIRRSGNQVAHALARAASSCFGLEVWESVPPSFISDVLAVDFGF